VQSFSSPVSVDRGPRLTIAPRPIPRIDVFRSDTRPFRLGPPPPPRRFPPPPVTIFLALHRRFKDAFFLFYPGVVCV